jgi:putative hydrolase
MLKKRQNITKNHIPMFDYHLHTNWTDGQNTSLEMYNCAVNAGLESILFSEHARKTSVNWFLDFANEIRNLPKSTCTAFVGVEAKVSDFHGNIDSVDEILDVCDLVMASVHRFPDEFKVTERPIDIEGNEAVKMELDLSLAVLENKNIDILGHPFGMSIRRFNIYPTEADFKKVIKKASETGVAIEVNPYYHNNLWEIIDWCQDFGTLISLGSNAHKTSQVGWVNRVLSEAQLNETR